jgi:hypothetical protein
MGRPELVLRVNKAAPTQHDCVENGQIKMTELNGIKTFTARQLILAENALLISCENLDTQLLMRDGERGKVLRGHMWIKYDVWPQFWEHRLFNRIEKKPDDEHDIVRRAVKFSQEVFTNLSAQENKKLIHWLFPDVASIKHSCDPNCQFDKLQDRAEDGICRLTVLKQMNPGDEITIDWYHTSDQRTKMMIEFGDQCTTEDCIKCASQAQKRAKC